MGVPGQFLEREWLVRVRLYISCDCLYPLDGPIMGGAGPAPFASPQSCALRRIRTWEESHVAGLGRSRSARRPAVDTSGDHSIHECAVEAGVTRGYRAPHGGFGWHIGRDGEVRHDNLQWSQRCSECATDRASSHSDYCGAIPIQMTGIPAIPRRRALDGQCISLQRAYQRDPEAIAPWQRQTYPALVRPAKCDGAPTLFWDESGFRADTVPGKTWGLRGQTPIMHRAARRQAMSAA